jgi:hypothetical protein
MADRHHRLSKEEQDKRDRELDTWMDRALGVRKPDPQPDIHEI